MQRLDLVKYSTELVACIDQHDICCCDWECSVGQISCRGTGSRSFQNFKAGWCAAVYQSTTETPMMSFSSASRMEIPVVFASMCFVGFKPERSLSVSSLIAISHMTSCLDKRSFFSRTRCYFYPSLTTFYCVFGALKELKWKVVTSKLLPQRC